MGVGGSRADAVRLPASPESVAVARRAVREALSGRHLDGLADTATLLVSELATNVLLHARTAFEVQVEQREAVLRVSVLDGAPRRPVRRRYGLDAGTGRGLGLVETLALSWGTADAEPPWAKRVWFELDPQAAPETDEGALYGEDWLALVDDL